MSLQCLKFSNSNWLQSESIQTPLDSLQISGPCTFPQSYLIMFFCSLTMLPTDTSFQYFKHMLFPISTTSHKQFLFIYLFLKTFFPFLHKSGSCSSFRSWFWCHLIRYHPSTPHSRCFQYSAHITLGCPLIFLNMNIHSQLPASVSLCWRMTFRLPECLWLYMESLKWLWICIPLHPRVQP